MSQSDKQARFSKIPGVDRLLEMPAVAALTTRCDRSVLADLVRDATADLRDRLREGESAPEEDLTAWITTDVERRVERLLSSSLRRVINATGVILHTNLGRAPLDPTGLQPQGSLVRADGISRGPR